MHIVPDLKSQISTMRSSQAGRSMNLNIKLRYDANSIWVVNADDSNAWIISSDVVIAANQHNLGSYFCTSLLEIITYAELVLKFANQNLPRFLHAQINEFNKMLVGSAFSSRKIT